MNYLSFNTDMKYTYLLTLALMSFLFSGCGNDLNLISIDEYITQNDLQVETTSTGLKYIIETPGNNERPTLSDEVKVKYRGYRTDDFTFDSSFEGVTFLLSNVIVGWQEGIQLFGKGGKGMLFIPSNLAYGNNPPSSAIPANADLIFDVEVLNF